MTESATARAVVDLPWRALSLGLVATGAGLGVAVALDALEPWSVLVAGLGYLLGAVLISAFWPRATFGWANGVTLARLVGGCWIAAMTLEAGLRGLSTAERLLLVVLATMCLILDGVDGWIARARAESSPFGARFDVETDAVLLLCLSVVVPILGVAGWWALLLSGLRYGYLLASSVVPALRVPLSPSCRGRVICVLVESALIAALLIDLVSPGWPASVVLALALACLAWSFARDIVWQAQCYRAGFARFGAV